MKIGRPDVVDALGSSEESVSVAIEDVDPTEWKQRVYDSEISRQADLIYKKPGYTM